MKVWKGVLWGLAIVIIIVVVSWIYTLGVDMYYTTTVEDHKFGDKLKERWGKFLVDWNPKYEEPVPCPDGYHIDGDSCVLAANERKVLLSEYLPARYTCNRPNSVLDGSDCILQPWKQQGITTTRFNSMEELDNAWQVGVLDALERSPDPDLTLVKRDDANLAIHISWNELCPNAYESWDDDGVLQCLPKNPLFYAAYGHCEPGDVGGDVGVCYSKDFTCPTGYTSQGVDGTYGKCAHPRSEIPHKPCSDRADHIDDQCLIQWKYRI